MLKPARELLPSFKYWKDLPFAKLPYFKFCQCGTHVFWAVSVWKICSVVGPGCSIEVVEFGNNGQCQGPLVYPSIM